MSSYLRVSFSGARSAAVGKDHGITRAELDALRPSIDAGHAAMLRDRRSKRIGFFDLPRDAAALKQVKGAVKRFTQDSPKNLVVLGIGGSALGTSTLVRALKPSLFNLLAEKSRGGHPRIFVVDNVDPETFRDVMNFCDPAETVYNVISKSGNTAETISQFIVVLDRLERHLGKKSIPNRVVVTSDPPQRGKAPSPLQALRDKYELHALTMPSNVGGRFSVFSAVGLFPAAMVGIEIDALLDGAAEMDGQCRSRELSTNPAYQRAAFQFLAYLKKGKVMSVLMPYADSLSLVSDWYRQLWAESLGKSRKEGDRTIRVGQTPIKALGVTDQHSQLQLYLEGPNDKIVTIIDVGHMRHKIKMPKGILPAGQAEYLGGKSMGELLQAECKATAGALREARRPVLHIRMDEVNAFSMGELLYMFELETAMTAQLLGVDAYDQPAVERIKVLTRKFLGGRS